MSGAWRVSKPARDKRSLRGPVDSRPPIPKRRWRLLLFAPLMACCPIRHCRRTACSSERAYHQAPSSIRYRQCYTSILKPPSLWTDIAASGQLPVRFNPAVVAN